jgi:flagellin
MGVRINTNIEALNAQRNLGVTSLHFAKAVEKLSSGLRINRAADDAAGLSISEKLRGQVKGLYQAVRNAQDAISLIQTAEGGLNEAHSILQRMRELAVQAANDTLTTSDREAISGELVKLRDEIDRIANNTQFNTKTLLTGSLNSSVDTATSELLQGEVLSTSTVVVSKLDVSSAAASTTYSITASGANVTLTNMSTDIAQTVTVTDMTATGTSTQVLNFSQLGVKITLAGYAAAATAGHIATDLSAAGNDTIITAASGSAVMHIGANSSQTVNVSVSDARSTAVGNAGSYASLSAAVDAFDASETQAIANALIDNLDQAISDISSSRSSLGAFQNRLEYTIANLNVSAENLASSESRIRDVDVAAEMVVFTRAQILQQAGTAILAQANTAPQTVLQLLR